MLLTSRAQGALQSWAAREQRRVSAAADQLRYALRPGVLEQLAHDSKEKHDALLLAPHSLGRSQRPLAAHNGAAADLAQDRQVAAQA